MQIPKISFRIHPNDLAKLQELADREGLKISDIVRRAISDFLRKNQ